MKNYIKTTLAFSILLGIFFSACTQKQVPNFAIVSGTLQNAGGGDVNISSRYTSISMDTVPPIQRVLAVDEAGAFVDTLFINGPREFQIGKDRSWADFSIQPGQHVQLTADFSDFQNSIEYAGDGAEMNTFLFKKTQLHNKKSSEYSESRKDDEATFRKKQDVHFKKNMDLLNATQRVSEEFIANAQKDMLYEKVRAYIGYAQHYKEINGEDAPELSSDFFDIVAATNMEDYSEFQRALVYQFMVRAYIGYEYSKAVDNIWTADPIIKLQLIKEKVSNKNMLNELFIMFGKYDVTSCPNLQEYYDFFMANVTNPVYREALTTQYKDLIATQAGQPSPEFINYKNIDGGTNSLSDFRGKYVYIDVWATWCGPCKAEIPYLKKVEKKYHGKNIEFISLSIDNLKNFDKWKKFVQDEELGGTQIIGDKEFKSDFVQKYQIKGIPQFILIDPDGKIVQAKAPRPSDPKLLELFTEIEI